jgi:hypothetical protein
MDEPPPSARRPRATARPADPPEVNEFITRRFRASEYPAWPRDRRREWRELLARELNERAARVPRAHAEWTEREVTTKLANLGLRVRADNKHVVAARVTVDRAVATATPRRLVASWSSSDKENTVARKLSFAEEAPATRPPPPADDSDDATEVVAHQLSTISLESTVVLTPPEPSPILVAESPPTLSPELAAVVTPPPRVRPPLHRFLAGAQQQLLAAAHVALEASFVHAGLKGTANEQALLAFLRANLATSVVDVAGGEVLFAGGAEERRATAAASAPLRRQLDLVLYDRRVPTLTPCGAAWPDARLFLAEAVVAIVEVKSRLSTTDVESSLCAAAEHRPLAYVLVAYATAVTLGTLAKEWAPRASDNLLAMVVFGEGTVLRRDGAWVVVRDDARCALASLYALLCARVAARSAEAPRVPDIEEYLC